MSGREETGLRDGLPIREGYRAEARPKPIRDRYVKLDRLREAGIEPYAYSFDPSHDLDSALAAYSGEEGPRVKVAGRILSLRDMGKSLFAHLGDRSGRLQIYVRRQDLKENDVELATLLDLGDWIGVEGPLFRTRTGEVTVRVTGMSGTPSPASPGGTSSTPTRSTPTATPPRR